MSTTTRRSAPVWPTEAPADLDRTLLRVEDLHVGFGDARDPTPVVKGVSFTLERGRCLAIVGESGSGKSVTARTIVGLTGGRSHVRAGRLELAGRDLRGLGDRGFRAIRGQDVGFILQDALVSLDPLRPVGREIAEALRLHGWGTRTSRHEKVVELLTQVGVPDAELVASQRPDELSGGLRQRALIASALALDPELVIADEPTTALDVTVQAQILELLEATKARGRTLILISHDLAVVSRMADDIAVMQGGEIVEQGDAREVLANPRHAYTRALLDAVPSEHSRGQRLSPGRDAAVSVIGSARAAAPDATVPVLEATDLVKRYRGPDGIERTVVDGVSFRLERGKTLGVVGESGSGKTTTARIALALTRPDGGEVLLDGEPWSGLKEKERRARRRQVSVIYQDPLSSFDPRWSVERILRDTLAPEAFADDAARGRRVGELLELVGLQDEHRHRRPLQLSGGQRQRVAIARALGPDPAVIVCDEPVSALDVSIQAQVLDLLEDLQRELGVSYLFISHDLGVIHHISDHVLVLSKGRVVEQGPADDVFRRPQEPYTQALLAAVPRLQRPGSRTAAAAD
ncbi:ABC transporter ATP-binding protein [Patulibacter sp.]|uniref:dipeptide ABC transporter ATP-binding protein n=1 Tax=Patulibacter sp. TaxID=1912859 RepID=UPI0027250B9D|nr:ABC transporter ATP-binding protein [Patulibacter sp.]MDO9407433.1 ABC transporter ATP-binding protein [Patulibacter sp.]